MRAGGGRVVWKSHLARAVAPPPRTMTRSERSEEVRRKRGEVGRLRAEVTTLQVQAAEAHASFRATVASMCDRHHLTLAERDDRIAWLEARLAEYARGGRPC